jgi:hypothetical protein
MLNDAAVRDLGDDGISGEPDIQVTERLGELETDDEADEEEEETEFCDDDDELLESPDDVAMAIEGSHHDAFFE